MIDPGPLPTEHPRSAVCESARRELASFLLEWHQRHELTSAEYAMLLSDELAKFSQRLVRIERREQ